MTNSIRAATLSRMTDFEYLSIFLNLVQIKCYVPLLIGYARQFVSARDVVLTTAAVGLNLFALVKKAWWCLAFAAGATPLSFAEWNGVDRLAPAAEYYLIVYFMLYLMKVQVIVIPYESPHPK